MVTDVGKTVLAGSGKEFHADFASLPTPKPDEEFSVTIRVRRKCRLPDWNGRRLTHEQHAELYGGDAASLTMIGSFAEAHDLRVIRARADSRDIVVRGTARA